MAGILLLGRQAESALIVGRRWGAWEVVLESELRAVTALEDRPAEAWARHQLGTRALCLGDLVLAEEQLTSALERRQALGDDEGAHATRHNLDLLRRPPPPSAGSEEPFVPPDGPRVGRRAWVLAVALAATDSPWLWLWLSTGLREARLLGSLWP